ncbi:hypothetical protein Trydic_g3161, partial [Trypoxylus dichotomus]
QLQVEPI